MLKRLNASGLLATTAIITCAVPVSVWAQAAAQTAPVEQPSAQDIVVTAQKRTENIQDVPKTVAVISQGQLANAGVSRIDDLAVAFPTVTATDTGQNSKSPGIRGIAPIANSVGVQAQTGIVVDDIPQSTFSTLANELTDVERVEVFAGPQATLSGRNAAGGLINFVTRAPSSKPSYEVRAEQTTDHQTRIALLATGPITQNLAYSASFVFNKWDGPYRNALDNNHALGGFNSKVGRIKLRWNATDKLTATLTGYLSASSRETVPVLAGGAVIAGGYDAHFIFDSTTRTLGDYYPGIQVGPNNRTVYMSQPSSARTRDIGGTLRLDYDLGKVGTVSSLSSYTYSTQPRTDIFIGAPTDRLVVNATDFSAFTDVRTKYATQELRLTSPGNQPFTYLVGAIYTSTNLAEPYYRLQIFPVNWDRTVSIDSGAIFGRATYQVTPRDSIIGGLRYQHDHIGYTWTFHQTPSVFSAGTNDYGFFGGEASYKHDFSRDMHAYVTYSQAETGRAYDVEDNNTAISGTLKPLASEHVHNWEAGFKSQLFDRALTFNLTAFWAKYSNYQIQSIVNGDINTAPVIRLQAVGKVQSKGVELTSALRIANSLHLNGTLAYTDTTIDSFAGAACYTGQTLAQGCVNGTQPSNLHGLSLPFSSKWRYTLGADYKPALSSNVDLAIGAFYTYQSSQHYDVLGDPLTYQKGFGLANIYIGPEAHDGRWSARLFVNNLFDKRNYTNLGHSTFYTSPSGQDVVSASYGRNSFRYGGIRLSYKY